MELCEGLGKRIREERETRGWSQRDLAEKATAKMPPGESVSHQSVQSYELGKQWPTAKPLLAIALALGVNPAYLLDDRAPYAWERTEGGLLAADVRRVAHWMLEVAKHDGPIAVLTEDEMPLVEDPRKGEDGGSRGVGTPLAADG